MKRYIAIFLVVFITSNTFGQTFCDSLQIHSIGYSPFADSTITILVENNSSELFPYPGFAILNSLMDTIAKEQVNYFGIGQSQVHYLNILDTNGLPNVSNSNVQLWTGFYDTVLCQYSMDLNLCGDSCITLYPNVGNFGGAIAINSYSWSVTDSDSNIVASGNFELNDTQQYDIDTICIVPGTYNLIIDPYTHTGGQIFAGLGAIINSMSISEPALPSGTEIPFSLMQNCVGVVNAIPEAVNNHGIRVTLEPNSIKISNPTNGSINNTHLYNQEGKCFYYSSNASSETVINTTSLANGVYFLVVKTTLGYHLEKLIIK